MRTLLFAAAMLSCLTVRPASSSGRSRGCSKTSERLPHDAPSPTRDGVILLVNELTQSNPEFQAMALQRCPQTLIIGSLTSGADGDIVWIPLPGQLTSSSGVGVFYPDGTPTQAVGVRLDAEVLPTAERLQAGRDEVLERALVLALED